jgi:hypothetical protein
VPARGGRWSRSCLSGARAGPLPRWTRTLLEQAGWLDQTWETLGVTPGHEHGQERLRDVALARLRR